MAKAKRKQCGCGEQYEPQHNKDNICPVCSYFVRGLHSKNILLVERLRHEYIKHYGKYISYGQFVAKLEHIERRRLHDARKKKEETCDVP